MEASPPVGSISDVLAVQATLGGGEAQARAGGRHGHWWVERELVQSSVHRLADGVGPVERNDGRGRASKARSARLQGRR